jgi:hypothetical protein
MIKSLYIPYNKKEFPTILFDTYDNLLSYSFFNTNVYTLNLKKFNMVLSYIDFSIEDRINKPATVLYRTYSSDYQYSVLYGNCLIFDFQNKDFPEQLIPDIHTIYYNI